MLEDHHAWYDVASTVPLVADTNRRGCQYFHDSMLVYDDGGEADQQQNDADADAAAGDGDAGDADVADDAADGADAAGDVVAEGADADADAAHAEEDSGLAEEEDGARVEQVRLLLGNDGGNDAPAKQWEVVGNVLAKR